MSKRRRLISLGEASRLYGAENVTFRRPRYVPEGFCEWCGSEIKNKRRTSCCCQECTDKFQIETSSVMYRNTGSASGYRNHIFRRDNYTCQNCGEFHAVINENGIPVPTTDGEPESVVVTNDETGDIDVICPNCKSETLFIDI